MAIRVHSAIARIPLLLLLILPLSAALGSSSDAVAAAAVAAVEALIPGGADAWVELRRR